MVMLMMVHHTMSVDVALTAAPKGAVVMCQMFTFSAKLTPL